MFLLIAQNKSPRLTGALSSSLIDVSGFLQSGIIYMAGGISDFFYRYISSVSQIDLIHQYRAEASQSATLKKMLYELSLENQHLKSMFYSVDEIGSNHFTAARVIGRKGAPLSRMIYINRGARHGISRGDAVICTQGAVGQVVLSGEHSSEVLLATDSASAIDVLVQSSRARGILRGSSDAGIYRFEVRDFDHLIQVKKGETIVTSGLGAKFPVGVPVGEVVSVEKERDGVYLVAKIRPTLDFSRLEHVLVIKNSGNASNVSMGDLIKYMIGDSGPIL